MRKALALALTLTVAFPDFRVVYAAGSSNSEAQAQGKIRNARRLGGPTSLNRPGLKQVDTLRQMMAKPNMPADIRKILSDAGISQTADKVLAAMTTGAYVDNTGSCGDAMPADGSVVECDFQPGAVLQWMALRPRAAKKDLTPGIIGPVRWSARRPFKAFLFRVTESNRVYTFVVPKDCGNLSLFADVAAPPPPPPPAPAPAPRPQAAPPPPPPPPPAQAPAPQEVAKAGNLNCLIRDAKQQVVSGATVRVRNAAGEIVATGTTNERGECAFPMLPVGTYTLEIVGPSGAVVGTSAPVAVTAATTATGAAAAGAAAAVTTVTVTTAAVAGTVAAAAAGGIGLFGLGALATTAVIATAGVVTAVAIHAATNDASPSR